MSNPPKDWIQFSLFKESQVKARIGWQGLTSAEYLSSGDYGLVGGTDFSSGSINWSNIYYVSKSRFEQDSYIKLRENDILLTKDGTIGKVAIAKNLPKPSTLNSGVYVVRPKNGNYNPNFIYHILKSVAFTDYVDKLSAGSTISHLYQRDLKHFEVLIPRSLDEQKAIAKALSDIDELSAELRLEIDKKKKFKIAFAQQALKSAIGKTVDLKTYADFSKGKFLPKSALSINGAFKAIHYGELFTVYPERINSISSRTNVSSTSHVLSISNDVLMPTSDVTPTGLATASCIQEDGVIIGGDVLIVRTNPLEINGVYLSYLIRNSKDEILKLVNGTTVYHLYGKDLANFEFTLPKIDYQNMVVGTLSLLQDEIDYLEKEFSKYECIKQGMMNDLLTGKVRLL